MLPDDPRRCDFVASDNDADTSENEGGSDSGHVSSQSDAESVYNGVPLHGGVPLIRAAIAPTPLQDLARREPFDQSRALDMRLGYLGLEHQF